MPLALLKKKSYWTFWYLLNKKNQKTFKIGEEIDEIHKFVFVNFLKCTDVHLLFVKPTIIKKIQDF